jgi:hypothetical protein
MLIAVKSPSLTQLNRTSFLLVEGNHGRFLFVGKTAQQQREATGRWLATCAALGGGVAGFVVLEHKAPDGDEVQQAAGHHE